MYQSSRQCLLRTDPPVPEFPFSTGGSGFIAHVRGRTCFFTARHIFSDANGEINLERLARIVVVRKWGDSLGRNLSFDNCYFPRIGDHIRSDQILNDMLLLVCHRNTMNTTDDGILVFGERARAATNVPQIGSPLSICGYPNLPGSTPIDYDSRVYRPNYVIAQAAFSGNTPDGHIGTGQVTSAKDHDGNAFPFDVPPDGMSGSLVYTGNPNSYEHSWAGMLIQSGNGIIRFILAHRMMEFAHQIISEEHAAGRW
jgi:hypothetical protein